VSAPRIAIGGVVRLWDAAERTGVNAAYARSVLAAGGVPIILSPLVGPAYAARALDGLDALLLTGGEDIDPARYGATPHPKLGEMDPRRDENELALVTESRERDQPILGICRGIQLCYVAFGGTLFQDLPSELPGTVDHDPPVDRQLRSHPITVSERSRLAELLGEVEFSANSFHHQAIDRLGTGLVASAVAPDGVIEGVESADPHEWIVAVQWHPEELAHEPEAADLKLFAALIAAARRG
jgi:putative glutamine amidotransferase